LFSVTTDRGTTNLDFHPPRSFNRPSPAVLLQIRCISAELFVCSCDKLISTQLRIEYTAIIPRHVTAVILDSFPASRLWHPIADSLDRPHLIEQPDCSLVPRCGNRLQISTQARCDYHLGGAMPLAAIHIP
jgi:hypothetical protein